MPHALWLLLWHDLPKAVRQSSCCKSVKCCFQHSYGAGSWWQRCHRMSTWTEWDAVAVPMLLHRQGSIWRRERHPQVSAVFQAGIGICQQEARGVWQSQAGLMSPRTGSRSTAVCKQGETMRTWCLQVHPPRPWCPPGTSFSTHYQKSSEGTNWLDNSKFPSYSGLTRNLSPLNNPHFSNCIPK